MELKRRRFGFRKLFTILYIVAFSVYLIIGLQPTEATAYQFTGGIAIPSINLVSGVVDVELENHKLNTPDTVVGSYSRYDTKTFLIGHSSTVFKKLHQVKIGDFIFYNDKKYQISSAEIFAKSDINMNNLLAPTRQNTLVIMTCAGTQVGEKDATHRLIVTALEI